MGIEKYEKIKENLKSNPITRLIAKPRIMRLFIKLVTKELCSKCRAKVMREPNLELDKYCDLCRIKAKDTVLKVKSLI